MRYKNAGVRSSLVARKNKANREIHTAKCIKKKRKF